MLNRKINPESFDQLLHAYRPPTETHEEAILPTSTLKQPIWIEPETGEILNAPPNFNQTQTIPKTQNPSRLNTFSSMIKQSTPPFGMNANSLAYLPWLIVLALQFATAWFIYSQSEFFEQSLKQSFLTIEDISKEFVAHKNQLNLVLEEITLLNELLESELDQQSKSKASEMVSLEKPITKINAAKKITRPSVPVLPIKYLGTAIRDENHQVLIESPAGVEFFRVGDLIFKDWRLSAIEPQKLLLKTIDGHQQIIPLTKIHP